MPPDSTIEWAITHGVPGVLVLVSAGLLFAVRTLYQQVNVERARADNIQQAHIDDLRKSADINAAKDEKLFKAADDIGRAASLLARRTP